MEPLAPRTRKTLGDLEAMLASAALPPRIARSCEALIQKLRRPIRVGLIGFEVGQRKCLLTALLGTQVMPEQMDWPTIEVGFAERPHTTATLADGSMLSSDGIPQADLLESGAVFLKVGAPLDALRRVTFLHLAVGEDPAEQSAALRWAARRVDFSLWCTRTFSPLEARIWSAAAPELKNHAYLVAFAPESEAASLRDRVSRDFERVVVLPGGNASRGSGATDFQAGARRLFEKLAADIDDALGEDLDAARLLLHRCGQRIDMAKPEPDPSPVDAVRPDSSGMDRLDKPETADMVDVLSEPLIFLKRQARDLFEALEWHDQEQADWAGGVLERCCEVTDGLRDRAAEWPEDEGPVRALRELVDDVSDMAALLQIEGGPEQAEDAAALLLQLRGAFEASMVRPAMTVN